MTLRDIAQQAGVDVSTVSLALRGHPRISLRTTRRIRELAEVLGYRPDPSLNHLAARRWVGKRPAETTTLAYLAPRALDGLVSDRDAYYAGVCAQAKQFGYQVDVIDPARYENDRHLSDVLYHRGIRGIIVGQTTVLDRAHTLEWDKFCVVQAGLNVETEVMTLVRCDLDAAVRGATRRAMEAGCRRIVLLLLISPGTASDAICVQAAEHLVAHPLEGTEIYLLIEDWQNVYDMREHLLQRTRQIRPDAVIQITPYLFLEWMKLGVRIPEEFAAVCIFTQSTEPFFAGMDLQAERVGALAVELLDNKLRHFEYGLPSTRVTVMVEPAWVSGQSLPE